MKTPKELEEQVNIIGTHLVELENLLRSVAFSQSGLYKLMADKVDSFTLAERELLTASAQACQVSLERTKVLSSHFWAVVERFSKP